MREINKQYKYHTQVQGDSLSISHFLTQKLQHSLLTLKLLFLNDLHYLLSIPFLPVQQRHHLFVQKLRYLLHWITIHREELGHFEQLLVTTWRKELEFLVLFLIETLDHPHDNRLPLVKEHGRVVNEYF